MNNLVRQIHRWVSIAFTLGVITNLVAISRLHEGEKPAMWVGLTALLPLIVLLLTGLYMFVLPYLARGRRARVAD